MSLCRIDVFIVGGDVSIPPYHGSRLALCTKRARSAAGDAWTDTTLMQGLRTIMLVIGFTASIAAADPVDSWRSGTGGDVAADPNLSAQAFAWCAAVYRVSSALSPGTGDTSSAESYAQDAESAVLAGAAALFMDEQREGSEMDFYSNVVRSWSDEHYSTMIGRLRRIDRSNPRSVDRGVRTVLGNVNKCTASMSAAQAALVEAASQLEAR
jgi:hypothetical protein